MWNEKYSLKTKHFQGDKKGAKWGQNANYRQFHYGNAIYSLQVEQNRYISSLQIYLDSVKWKIFVTGVTKHFHGDKKGAKWGQNANYRQFHYGNAIYSLQVEQNRYISSLQIYLDSVKWKIFVTGVTKHFQGVKKEAKWGQNANYRQFHYGNAIYSLQVEQNRYISSLQIYLDSVKWKIFVTGVTKHFQGVKKGAKWGQNANYRQFHYGNAIYSLQVEQNRYISSLQIYLDSVKWKIFVTGVTKHFQGDKKGAKWGQNANYRQFHYGNAIYSLQVEQNRYISSLQIYLDSVKWKIFVTGVTKGNGAKMLIDNFQYSLQVEQNRYVITDIPGQCEMKNIRYWGNQALPWG